MAGQATTIATLKHVGGHPVLDFVNSRHHWIGTGPDREYLTSYADLLQLVHDIGVLDARESRALARAAQADSAAAARTHRESLVLRHALHEVLEASIAGRAVCAADAREFDNLYRRAARTRGASFDRRGRLSVAWVFPDRDPPLELPLLKLAWSAAEFMLAVEPGRLKECPAEPGCGWLFHDTSKNRSRRWCDMSDCGNIAKARRHYARVRTAREASVHDPS